MVKPIRREWRMVLGVVTEGVREQMLIKTIEELLDNFEVSTHGHSRILSAGVIDVEQTND